MADGNVDTRTFGERLHAAAARCRRLAKTGHNDHFDYDYVTEADVKRLVGDALVAESLIVLRVDTQVVSQETYTNAKGKPQHRMVIQVQVAIKGAYPNDGNEHIVLNGVGTGVDGEDKAAYKAMAGALKYALTMGFLIATGDDPERDTAPESLPVPTDFDELKAAIPALLKANQIEDLKAAIQALREHPRFKELRAAYQSAVNGGK